MKTHISDPVEFANAVVQFVEFPQRWNAMEQIVNEELEEVFRDEEDDKLQPKRALRKEPDRFRHAQEIWAECLG